ncbi:unnamed protein product [Closterium sp. NIES-53]
MEAREKVKQGKQTMELWWMWHCTEWPELARLARRNLSQPRSVTLCKRNWSMWDLVHTTRRSKLGSVKCRDHIARRNKLGPVKVLEDEYEEYLKKPQR